MKNPTTNRIIGYTILFLGFAIFYGGFHATITSGSDSDIDVFAIIISIIVIIFSVIWMFKMVRCPHCNGMLNPKITNIDVCPHCGKRTDKV